MIWLIDYTHYHKDIAPRLRKAKIDYFRIKSYHRYHVIGQTAPVKTAVFSTGLLRIGTILSHNGYAVRYLHADMLRELLHEDVAVPDKVAFSCVCPTVPGCADLAKRIKEKNPNARCYIGGPHINMAARETGERFPVFDVLVEGYERKAAEVIAGAPLEEDPPRYVDYSILPYPLHHYAINTFTTMGCPFHCNYCVDGRAPQFTASGDGQISEMMELLPPRTLIHFFDSVLGHSAEGIRKLCTELKALRHPFLLSCDMRAELLTPEIVHLLEEAGFVEIRMGMESVNDGLLQKNGRTLMFQTFVNQLKMVRRESKLYITLYTITGLPGTTEQIQEQTLRGCHELFREKLVDEIKNALYVPYPMVGTDYKERGIEILNHDWSQYDRQSFPVFRTQEMEPHQLYELYLKTAERINQSWLEGLGFSSIDEVPLMDGYYSEYVEEKYVDNAP